MLEIRRGTAERSYENTFFREFAENLGKMFEKYNNIEILWASTREIYNIFEAINCGCDIITLSENIYQKLSLINKDLTEYSKETVNQFVSDGCSIKL